MPKPSSKNTRNKITIQDFFQTGMKRFIPRLLDNYGDQLELGPGHSPIGVPSLEYPDWDADVMSIPRNSESVDVIHMYHFLEHVKDPRFILKECERVLRFGGHVNIVIPHQSESLAFTDLDHKTFFGEDTIPNLLCDKGYDKNYNWTLKVHSNFIMAIVKRNLAIFTQLIKVKM